MNRRQFLRYSLTGAAGFAAALAVACSPAPSPPAASSGGAGPTQQAAPASSGQSGAAPAGGEQPQQGGELVVGLWQDPTSLDPINTNGIGLRSAMLMYDTLVMMDKDFKFHPSLAESWQLSSDGTTYTFKLKPNVKFHDGTPFNSAAVKTSFDRATGQDAKATFSISLRGIYDSTETPDDLTAVIKLKQPFAPFLDAISEAYYGIASPAAIQKYGKDFDRNPVGTGQYVFKEWTPKSQIIIKKNPDYNWGSALWAHQGPAYLDQISLRLISENATRMATLETGEIQIAEEIPTTDVERLKGDPKYQVINHTYPGGPAQLQMNTEKAPLDELAVRQALEYAINQDQLVKVLFQGVYTAAKAPTSPGTLGYDESLTKTYTFDLAKAQQLLDQAGWKPGSDGIRTKNGQALEISNNAISETPITGQAAEFIQAQLRDVGVRLTIQQLDTGAWNAAVAAGSQMTVIGWRGSSDPDFMRPIFHSSFIGKSPLQRSHFKDDKLDQLLTDGTKEQDPTKRAAIYVEAQKIILDQALIVPLWDRYNFVGARATVRGLTFDPRGYPRLYDVWMAKG